MDLVGAAIASAAQPGPVKPAAGARAEQPVRIAARLVPTTEVLRPGSEVLLTIDFSTADEGQGWLLSATTALVLRAAAFPGARFEPPQFHLHPGELSTTGSTSRTVTLVLGTTGAEEGDLELVVEATGVRLSHARVRLDAQAPVTALPEVEAGRDFKVAAALPAGAHAAPPLEARATAPALPVDKADQDFKLRPAPASGTGLASLMVRREADGKNLRITGFYSVPLDELSISVPVSLMDGPPGPPEDLLAEVRLFAAGRGGRVADWFRRLLELKPDERPSAIAIFEDGETRIPWELIAPSEEQEWRPIGAQVMVVRWLLREFYGKPVEFQGGTVHRRGKLLGFAAGSQVEHAELERVRDANRGELCASFEAMCEALRKVNPDVALIFISGKGYQQKDKSPGAHLKGLEIGGVKLRDQDVTFFKATSPDRPVVFVNACHSAIVMPDGKGDVSGFPTLFIPRLASAYLGTLGYVDEKVAHEFGAKVLASIAAAPDGLSLPKLLWDLRREASDAVATRSESDTIRAFVTKFLYVLYSGPQLNLALV